MYRYSFLNNLVIFTTQVHLREALSYYVGLPLKLSFRSLQVYTTVFSVITYQSYTEALDMLKCHCTNYNLKYPNCMQGYFYQISKGGGAFEILDLFWHIFDLLEKLWTFSMPQGWEVHVSFKRSTIVDLSVYAAWLRGPDISQNIQKRFTKYSKIDCRAFATARDIPNCWPFWVVKIQGGSALWPPW